MVQVHPRAPELMLSQKNTFSWKEIVELCLPNSNSVSIPEIGQLVNIARQRKVGTPISYQKTSYSESNIAILCKLLKWWRFLNKTSSLEFRDKFTSKKIQQVIIDVVLSGHPLLVYSVFCPSYKKGVGEIGYVGTTGSHTKKMVSEISTFIHASNEIIPTHGIAYFSDLLLENYNLLKNTAYRSDLASNYSDFQQIFESQNSQGIIETKLLSEVQAFTDKIGEFGLIADNPPIPADICRAVYLRNLVFYKENLGWSEDQVATRTKILAASYAFMGNTFRILHKSGLMYWTESAYERGRMYSGMDQQNPLPIIYPIKNG
ncbi:MAG: hypothetical protein UX99_C0003G0016 [Candidatus Amesbacteria bacterium GW2011_GWB1_47_26]|uniref:Uncharacterized protein n=1 Tax=Candidatus Amesbacteria bacterium GW2011_GWC2_45_19 TaxID=1618366 RepID=A0A0G1M526_9BACT|nr:MAG: hypothetical protein UX05_C0003G0016 [Candidatus Amesbacteria bacterium GW2011_GWC2_45_19]KKU38636.1 MAG: hypothetical protein UX52_C0002G0016 [Candidatus Amesbacteria bacterium GW2011_GWA1_46_35]KKU68660.1 MAG: hypothetical protein UX93_C0006G0077 [Microgenomates group bacterium GW2011_GWC1_47_20]KKU74956.1 MAG: hypothetical protein UX99_C0003G0016 [Candidatus Amesbacteria bacterium GW2011_GWB1_47_26]KKU80255.1 MAG: hypothetical protein UY06_C0003G0017 [Candidatus Amesbacteria bacteriu